DPTPGGGVDQYCGSRVRLRGDESRLRGLWPMHELPGTMSTTNERDDADGFRPGRDEPEPEGQHTDLAAEWESRYAASESVWSGNPNAVLAQEAPSLAPGRALDVGCGEGADVIWLAERGWHVTGIDLSETALARGAERAAARGLAERITWVAGDITKAPIDQRAYDLVSVHYLHFRDEELWRHSLQASAAAVAPDGHLLIVSHESFPPWAKEPETKVRPEEIIAALELEPGQWQQE